MGAAVALLAAMHRGDIDGADLIMQTVDHEALCGLLLGMLSKLGPAAAGSPQRWADMLAAWQPGSRLGDDT